MSISIIFLSTSTSSHSPGTQLCNLWFENFEFTDLDMFDGCEDKDDILRVIKNYIKDYVEEVVEESRGNASGFINDLISSALGEIDYYDIAEHYVDDVAAKLEANNTEENEVEMYPVDKDALVFA